MHTDAKVHTLTHTHTRSVANELSKWTAINCWDFARFRVDRNEPLTERPLSWPVCVAMCECIVHVGVCVAKALVPARNGYALQSKSNFAQKKSLPRLEKIEIQLENA